MRDVGSGKERSCTVSLAGWLAKSDLIARVLFAGVVWAVDSGSEKPFCAAKARSRTVFVPCRWRMASNSGSAVLAAGLKNVSEPSRKCANLSLEVC